MKHKINVNYLGFCLFIGIVFLCVGCGNKTKPPTQTPLVIHINDYKSGLDMIDSLVQIQISNGSGRWSESSYKEIDNQISVAFSYRKMTENQMTNLYDALLEGSSVYSLTYVKQLMKQSVVRESEVRKYIDMNKFLSKEFKDKHAMNNLIMQKSQFLNESIDMLSEYQRVKRLSETSFQKQAKLYNGHGERYTYASCADIEYSMKNSKYWTDYFSNNASFKTAIPQFSSRRETAINKYYNDLLNLYKQDFNQGVILEDGTIDYSAITRQQNNNGEEFIFWAEKDGANSSAKSMSSFLDSKNIR